MHLIMRSVVKEALIGERGIKSKMIIKELCLSRHSRHTFLKICFGYLSTIFSVLFSPFILPMISLGVLFFASELLLAGVLSC